MSDWPITTERYVAFLDVMGFKHLLKTLAPGEMYRIMKALHDRARMAEKQAKGMLGVTDTGTPKSEKKRTGIPFLQVAQFSDSVIAITRDDSPVSSISVRLVAMGFIFEGLSARVPLRGAIARGFCTADFEHSIFYGQPIVDAYQLGEDQQWYGVAEHESCEPIANAPSLREIQSNEIPLSEPYYVPLKSGNRDLCVINWPVFIQSERELDESLSAFVNASDPKLHMYYRHTQAFALQSWRKYRRSSPS